MKWFKKFRQSFKYEFIQFSLCELEKFHVKLTSSRKNIGSVESKVFGSISLLNGISTFVGYLMPTPCL